jgi:hypothetical protein
MRVRIRNNALNGGKIKYRILGKGKATNLRKLVVQVPLATLYMGQKTRWCSVSHIRLNTSVTLL